MKMPAEPIILASASPRRAELLQQLGIPFETIASHTPEIEDESIPPEEVALQNALLKGRAVAALHPSRAVLAADTVVTLDARLFGKPANLQDAGQMLQTLQGRTHQVITGVALITPMQTRSFAERTHVTFRPLTLPQIREYLAKVAVLDKAGAYAIQEHGDLIIDRIDGSYSNVVGLPVEKLESTLREFGLFPR